MCVTRDVNLPVIFKVTVRLVIYRKLPVILVKLGKIQILINLSNILVFALNALRASVYMSFKKLLRLFHFIRTCTYAVQVKYSH